MPERIKQVLRLPKSVTAAIFMAVIVSAGVAGHLARTPLQEWSVNLLIAAGFSALAYRFMRCLERVNQNMEVGESETKAIRAALDNSADVAITDAKGRILFVNDRFCELSKYSREELLGQTHRIVNSGVHPKEFFQELWQTISSGKTWSGEVCNRAKDSDLFWEMTTITPVIGRDGKPSQYVVIRHDITRRVIMEQSVHSSE